MNTNNKVILLQAIDDYEPYTVSQRAMLKIIIALSIDDVADVSCRYMMKNAHLSRPSVYLNLKKFENDTFIKRIRKTGSKQDSYQLNQEKLDYIVQLYNNKKAVENM